MPSWEQSVKCSARMGYRICGLWEPIYVTVLFSGIYHPSRHITKNNANENILFLSSIHVNVNMLTIVNVPKLNIYWTFDMLPSTFPRKYAIAWRQYYYPDTKVHGANMGPTWVPDGPHVVPINLTIRAFIHLQPQEVTAWPSTMQWLYTVEECGWIL